MIQCAECEKEPEHITIEIEATSPKGLEWKLFFCSILCLNKFDFIEWVKSGGC